MRTLIQDLRYVMRSLRKSRGFALASGLTLALGLAANIIVFSVINASLLHFLPYPQAERLVVVHWQDEHKQTRIDVSAAAFSLLEERSSSLQDVSAIFPLETGVNLSGSSYPQYVKALRVSKNFFRVLKVM